ncbi:MAG: hypothetical protein ACRCWM_06220 [Sarcina sp.]
MWTSLGIAAFIFIAYVITIIVVRPDKIDFKIFKHISFKIEKRQHKDKEN